MHMPMLGAVDGPAIGRDRDLKHTAVVVMNPPTFVRGMFMLTRF
jgi:hypothetical protein